MKLIENMWLSVVNIFEKQNHCVILLFQSQLLYTNTRVCLIMRTHFQEQQAWPVIKKETTEYLVFYSI